MEMTLDEIKTFSKETLWGRFPYDDCHRLQSLARKSNIVPELDTYFSTIAGLASGSHWQQWPIKKLRRCFDYLQKDAYGHCKALSRYRDLITAHNTPELHRRLEGTNKIRQQLIPHIEAIITPRELAARISKGRNK
jgi:hypothetical protein